MPRLLVPPSDAEYPHDRRGQRAPPGWPACHAAASSRCDWRGAWGRPGCRRFGSRALIWSLYLADCKVSQRGDKASRHDLPRGKLEPRRPDFSAAGPKP